ncbi:FMN-dependent alpha-hydroxy acid dehydrogenase [Bimuria novae-zelandiae CBS 107.79]|uniref:FMN-dependent alpha-hydroxy acid dehydrogenase n=1 Tax=Bimuria novae-zelandiae CBS 107.79 TaxID=1447943 RepID=A0A6A5VQF8_9PLEO|nr:FMN-dependent alpha-hydroxy acid dehydrogenase [Bimuria novae-zelandiae CBS 107.79]
MATKKTHDLRCLCIDHLEKLAAERMDKQTRDYYNEGADSGSSLAENKFAYQKYRIRPRVLRDVSYINTSANAFSYMNSIPLGVAPTAMQCLAHPDGELATARACKETGIVMGLRSFSTTSLENVKSALGDSHPAMLQLYLFESRDLIARTKKAGQPGHHDGERWISPNGRITFHTHAPNPKLSWDRDIEWLKKECHPEMEVWVKGIATAEDAILAYRHGVDGTTVSNHGGRQLNGAIATIDALPKVVEAVRAVNRKVPVHVDGGIRHGTDVVKALALGADFVWIGRSVLWGLAYKGQEGVELCLRLLNDEIRLCMALAGVTKVEDISKEYLARISRDGFVSRL